MMSPFKPKYELDHGEILMRLVVTRCHLCEKITDAKHAETIHDLEQISSFICEKNGFVKAYLFWNIRIPKI